jgi:DNA-directed RNA polymerase specialized sigma24 family protein
MEESLERVERLLALLLVQSMKGASKQEKAIQLNLAGFSNVEIADILGTSGAVVAQLLYESRKSRRRRQ